jgi:hypothetical protein
LILREVVATARRAMKMIMAQAVICIIEFKIQLDAVCVVLVVNTWRTFLSNNRKNCASSLVPLLFEFRNQIHCCLKLILHSLHDMMEV